MINTRDIDQLTLDVVRKSIAMKIVPLTYGAEFEIDLRPHVRYIEAEVKLIFPSTKPNAIIRKASIPRGWFDMWKYEHVNSWYCRLLRTVGFCRRINYRTIKLEVQYRHLLPRLKLPSLLSDSVLEVQAIKVASD